MRGLALGGAALLALACGGNAKPAEPPPAPPAPVVKPAPDLSKELSSAVAVRKLESRTPVALREVSRPALAKELQVIIKRDMPPERIVGESLFLKILGLVPLEFDYLAATVKMMQSELAGFYDSKGKAMVVAEDLGPELRRDTLVHELVHALQDQHFGLGDQLEKNKAENDRASALHALAEGDATSATLDASPALQGHDSTQIGDEILIDRMRSGLKAAMPGVPGILKRSAMAPYIDGLVFVNELRRSGGWDLVNEAWKKPPRTTEELLHPEKYANPEVPRAFAAGKGPGTECKERFRETIGEQGIRTVLEEWLSEDDARAAARGWNGDLAEVFECGRVHALLWRLAYDGKGQASAGVEAFRSGLGHCKLEPLGVRTARLVGSEVVVGALVGPGVTCEQLSDWVRLAL
jgi:hypothetical protein